MAIYFIMFFILLSIRLLTIRNVSYLKRTQILIFL